MHEAPHQGPHQLHAGMNRMQRQRRAIVWLTGVYGGDLEPCPEVIEQGCRMTLDELTELPHMDLIDALMGAYLRFHVEKNPRLVGYYQSATVRLHAECLRRSSSGSRRD